MRIVSKKRGFVYSAMVRAGIQGTAALSLSLSFLLFLFLWEVALCNQLLL